MVGEEDRALHTTVGEFGRRLSGLSRLKENSKLARQTVHRRPVARESKACLRVNKIQDSTVCCL